MASGLLSAGVDLDQMFEPRSAGDSLAIATSVHVAGVDINQRYAPASVGTPSAATTGFRQGGAEIAPRFAAIGSRPVLGSTLGMPSGVFRTVQGLHPVTSSIEFTVSPDGTWSIYKGFFITGDWITPASGSALASYEVQFAFSGDGDVINGAGVYTALTSARSLEVSVTSDVTSGVADSVVTVRVRKVGTLSPVSESVVTVHLVVETNA